jgi:hypothetical protein
MINPDNFMVNHFHLIFDMNQKKEAFFNRIKSLFKNLYFGSQKVENIINQNYRTAMEKLAYFIGVLINILSFLT